MGVIVVSDDVPELVAVCDRVAVVRAGRVAGEFAGEAITPAAIEEAMAL
jgi:ABC-type sugar transport system ATPase subunit